MNYFYTHPLLARIINTFIFIIAVSFLVFAFTGWESNASETNNSPSLSSIINRQEGNLDQQEENEVPVSFQDFVFSLMPERRTLVIIASSILIIITLAIELLHFRHRPGHLLPTE